MSPAQIIDGKVIAAALRAQIGGAVSTLKTKHDVTPGLAVVLVGEDPASQVYVRNKGKMTVKAGMASFEHKLAVDTSEADLLALVKSLNEDKAVHGILVQLPLPGHIDTRNIIDAINPDKDVDGLHPVNAGRLMTGLDGLVPCTPLGCMLLAKSVRADLAGMEALVIGRSTLVGKPVAQLLLNENCTVTMAHSRTKDLPEVARRADLLVAAVGRPQMIKGDWIKEGAIVIDVGINRIEGEDGKPRLVGDVDYNEAARRASAITPVPGGAGPMTIACLLRNTLQAACTIEGLEHPGI